MTIRQNLDCSAVPFSFTELGARTVLGDVLGQLATFMASDGVVEVAESQADVGSQAAERIGAFR